MDNESTLEQQVDQVIAKSRNDTNWYQNPWFSINRDNSHNYGWPPFQANSRSKGDFWQAPRCPSEDIRQNLRGPEPSAAGPFGETDGSQPIQCFRCWGWGHPKRLCPSCLNYTRGEWYGIIPHRPWTKHQEVLLPRIRTRLLNSRYENIPSSW